MMINRFLSHVIRRIRGGTPGDSDRPRGTVFNI